MREIQMSEHIDSKYKRMRLMMEKALRKDAHGDDGLVETGIKDLEAKIEEAHRPPGWKTPSFK